MRRQMGIDLKVGLWLMALIVSLALLIHVPDAGFQAGDEDLDPSPASVKV